MKRTATTVRCIPRFGYSHTQLRTIEVDLPEGWDDADLHAETERYFLYLGIAEALYAIEYDDDGHFAVVNDEVFHEEWGEHLI